MKTVFVLFEASTHGSGFRQPFAIVATEEEAQNWEDKSPENYYVELELPEGL